MKWTNYTLLFLLIIIINSGYSAILDTIVLQEGTDGFTGWQDASVYSNSPDYNYDGDLLSLSHTIGNKNELILIKVPMPSLPDNATIESAYLSIFCGAWSYGPVYSRIYRNAGSWKESTVTYNNRPPVYTSDYVSFISAANEAFCNINVKDWVLGFCSNEYYNAGFTIEPDPSHNFYQTYKSSENYNVSLRPKLIIIYSLPDPVNNKPTVASPIPDLVVNEDTSDISNYADCNNVFNDIEDLGALTFSIKNNSNSSLVNVTINSDSAIDITFFPNKYGNATIIIEAIDSGDSLVLDTFNIAINPINDTVTVMPDTISMYEGNSVILLTNGNSSVMDNDINTNGMDNISSVLVDSTSHGMLILDDDGTFLYKHDHSENFTDSFTYKTFDGTYESSVAKVLINVKPLNDNRPFPLDDSIFVSSIGGSSNVTISGNYSILDNDSDNDLPYDTLKSFLIENTLHGTFSLNENGTFNYQHDGTINLKDSAIYQVRDSLGRKDTAKIFISIGVTYTNKPSAENDTIVLEEGASTILLSNGNSSLLSNDNPNDYLDDLSSFILENPINGSLVLNVNGTFSYTHNGSEVATDQFKYYVNDLGGLKDTATVYIKINLINDNSPIAVVDSVIVDEGASISVLKSGDNSVLDNDIDVDGMGGVSAILVENTINGAITLNADGTFNYIHNDSESFIDSFKYKVSDGDLESDIVSVFIIINPVNDNSPIASRDTIKVNQGESSMLLANGMSSVLSNDFDIDINEVLSVKIFNDVSNGFLMLNSDGTFKYSHDGSSNFNDSFSYIVIDNAENSDTETVSIIIDPKTDIIIENPNSDNSIISFGVVPTIVKQGGEVSFIINGDFRNLKVDAFIYDALGDEIYSDKYWVTSSQRRDNYLKFGTWDMSKGSIKSIKNQSLLIVFRVYKADGTFLGTEKCLIGVKKMN